MAKIYSRSGKLYIDYMVDGNRHRKSTKLDDTKENRTMLERTVIPDLERRIATGEIYKQKPKTFGHYFDIYEKTIDRNRSYFTKKPHRQKVRDYFGDRNIDTITRLEIKQFVIEMPILSRSKGVYLTTLIGTFEQAVDDAVIATNPAIDIKLTKEPKPDIEWWSVDEVQKILSNATGVLKSYLMIAFHTGMRPEETLALQWGDFSDTHIQVRRVKTNGQLYHFPKTDEAKRAVPYPSFIMDYVKELRSNSLFLFPDIRDSRGLYRKWYKLLKKCELPKKKLNSARHTFATNMMLGGHFSLNELAGILGHTTPKTTLTHYSSIINAKKIMLEKDFDPFGTKLTQLKNQMSQNVAI